MGEESKKKVTDQPNRSQELRSGLRICNGGQHHLLVYDMSNDSLANYLFENSMLKWCERTLIAVWNF